MRGPDDPILGYCSRLLRGGEGDPSVAPAVLAATVRAHGVAGLLLETAPMSQPALAPQRVVLMGLARQDAVRDMAATLEVRRVLDILDEAGIASADTTTVEQRRAFVSLVQKARTLAPAEPASATLKPAPAAAP